MRFIVNSRGEYYHIIEDLKCPLKENSDDYIILESNQIIYWVKSYGRDMKLNIEMMKQYLIETETATWRSLERKKKTLQYLEETLSKMIAYEREIKIDEVLDKTPKDYVWLAC